MFEPIVEQTNLEGTLYNIILNISMSSSINFLHLLLVIYCLLDCLEPLHNGEAAYHEPDEEARIFMDQGMCIAIF